MKPFSQMSRQELDVAVDQRKALPDMILKRIIFDAQNEMNDFEKKLSKSRLQNNGFVNPNDVINLRVAIGKLFRLIGEMCKDVKVLSFDGVPRIFRRNVLINDYDLCFVLLHGEPLDIHTILHLCSYMNYCLHKLNLTNLLIDNQGSEESIDTY